jgi:hypothetical protein
MCVWCARRSLEPLRAYAGEDVTVQLPGGLTVAAVRWLSVWDARARRSLASVLVPEQLNVPPALQRLHPYRFSLLPSTIFEHTS